MFLRAAASLGNQVPGTRDHRTQSSPRSPADQQQQQKLVAGGGGDSSVGGCSCWWWWWRWASICHCFVVVLSINNMRVLPVPGTRRKVSALTRIAQH